MIDPSLRPKAWSKVARKANALGPLDGVAEDSANVTARSCERRTLITADDLETWLARLPQKIVNRTEGGAA
jgi:hypothetical protein